MKKRLICLVLTLCMAFSVFSASAFATLTDEETVEPSASVEPAPEATPADVPSEPLPTPADTESPAPTVAPTETPDATPSAEPTEAPTPTPSSEPDETPIPSDEPTPTPTPNPTDEPDTTPAPVPGTLEYVQSLIDALPDADSVTEENREDIMSQLDAIDEARLALPEDADIDSLDFTKYELLCTALGEDHTPETLEGEVYVAQIGVGESALYFTSLSEAITKANESTSENPVEVKLLRSVTITETLEITGKAVTLDLAGQTITKTGAPDSVIKVASGGNLTLMATGGGTITGGDSVNGGGVFVKSGSFIMQSGTITGCSATHGGGVCVDTNGSFTMQGGTITGCSATLGGGVKAYSSSTFTMTGGEIGNNISNKDGKSNAIYADGMDANGGTVSDTVTFVGKVDSTTDGGTTFNGKVYNNSFICGGTYNGEVECAEKNSKIYGGTFNGTVTLTINSAAIYGGTFNGRIVINAEEQIRGTNDSDKKPLIINAGFTYGLGAFEKNSSEENDIIKNGSILYEVFDAGDGNPKTQTLTFVNAKDNPGVDFPIEDPNRDGYEFIGWYNSDTGEQYVYKTTHAVKDGTDSEIDKKGVTTVTYTAKWEADQYKLSFNSNGGTAIAPTVGVHGTVIDLTQAKYRPTRYGYIFTGWYTDAKLTTRVASLTLTENTTLVAGWTLNTWGAPRTGDDSNIALYAALMGGSLILIAAAAVVIIKKKKRK